MFIITKDYIENGAAEGTCGPGEISDADIELLRSISNGNAPHGVKAEHFYMYDDDGQRYYAGYYLESEDSDEFEPLDCFGMPNAGCTEIRMKNKDGKYTTV